MKSLVLLILAVFASEKKENVENDPKYDQRIGNSEEILVKIEEDEYAGVKKTSIYIGVNYRKNRSKWRAQRWDKNKKKMLCNGSFDDEETAARASDTLARKLIENGEKYHKLNFPDDHTKVLPYKGTSKFIGVFYSRSKSKWRVQRWSKHESSRAHNGYYANEETAAHASDTLARKFIKNGELNHKLNFPDDHIEVYPEKDKKFSSGFIGVSYDKRKVKWCVQRRSKYENTNVSNGCYDDEESATHASDTLARQLMKNGEQGHKLNFPDDHTEVYREEKIFTSKFIGVTYDKNKLNWCVHRRSKYKQKSVYNGSFDNEETAAHASDTLARKLMKNGEQGHKLNFPDDHTQVYPQNQNNKRKRPQELEHHQNN